MRMGKDDLKRAMDRALELGYSVEVIINGETYEYSDKEEDKKVCCICGKTFYGYGNNPWPLNKDEDARCCDECNNKVIAARIAGLR